MSSSEFSVSKSAGKLVVPCEPTPSHTLLLSVLDKISEWSPPVEMFFVYEQGQEPAEVIRQALSKALVPYYPLAGRLVRSQQGELQVACTGDGVLFVEASANCSLQDVGRLEQPLPVIPNDQLLPLTPSNPPAPGTNMPLVMMQVTQFTCGSFVVGLMYHHVMADGIGIGQFMNALVEIARGLDQPTIKPIWCREFFPNPSPPPNWPSPPFSTVRLEYLIVDVPLDYINQLKQRFTEATGEGCSMFDVTMAKLLQCRTRAIDPELGAADVIDLYLTANTRHLLRHALFREGGYYGNCIQLAKATAPTGKIVDGSIAELVGLIRDAKKRLPDEFSKWADGAFDDEEDQILIPKSVYKSVWVTDWRKLGFSEVDYGWGRPSYFTRPPQLGLERPPMCTVINPPAPKQGIRLLTYCVKKEHLQAFHDGMLSLS